MDVTDEGLEQFLVEWYGPRATVESISDTAGRLNDGAASISADGARIQLLMAVAVPADDYVFGVFAAENAQTVAQACVAAGAPAGRISAAVGWPPT
jgi:hypothetical protein